MHSLNLASSDYLRDNFLRCLGVESVHWYQVLEMMAFFFSHSTTMSIIMKAKLCRPCVESLSADILFAEKQSPKRQAWIAFYSHWHQGNLLWHFENLHHWWGEEQGPTTCQCLLSEILNVLAAHFTACTSPVLLWNRTHHVAFIISGSCSHIGKMTWWALVHGLALNPNSGMWWGSPSERDASPGPA